MIKIILNTHQYYKEEAEKVLDEYDRIASEYGLVEHLKLIQLPHTIDIFAQLLVSNIEDESELMQILEQVSDKYKYKALNEKFKFASEYYKWGGK